MIRNPILMGTCQIHGNQLPPTGWGPSQWSFDQTPAGGIRTSSFSRHGSPCSKGPRKGQQSPKLILVQMQPTKRLSAQSGLVGFPKISAEIEGGEIDDKLYGCWMVLRQKYLIFRQPDSKLTAISHHSNITGGRVHVVSSLPWSPSSVVRIALCSPSMEIGTNARRTDKVTWVKQ